MSTETPPDCGSLYSPGALVRAELFVDEEPPATTVAAEAGTAEKAVVTAQIQPRSRAFMREAFFFMGQILLS
ncbi:hypothetical protein DXA97_02065 [Clostridium sp. OF09-36]|nr:hypothetical protein DXA97_02065 [Clostridium sp. OF09-36]